ncbi:hypothetical protein [Pararhodonellum marinum]|uniref:hypothetical protein n=1 Tax=Pararhodonellum marinum TaxID=2755358 RepID=UPI00188E1F09|nr:hypothetical protein [Pararhodonellum marinum]
MLFGKLKPTVTEEDKQWIEDVFIWFEEEYGRVYLKNVPVILPTKEFFPFDFKGNQSDVHEITKLICQYLEIKGVDIELHFFNDHQIKFSGGLVTAQEIEGSKYSNRNTLGTFSENGVNRFSIGIENQLLLDPVRLVATIAHELSHLVLLGEGRIEENDEELTDLNIIAMGFGVFKANSIFSFSQWQGTSHQGWEASRIGYIPEEMATYALALMANYQEHMDLSWSAHLNTSCKNMFERNLKFIQKNKDAIRFK